MLALCKLEDIADTLALAELGRRAFAHTATLICAVTANVTHPLQGVRYKFGVPSGRFQGGLAGNNAVTVIIFLKQLVTVRRLSIGVPKGDSILVLFGPMYAL
jgi:hypothetical protein